MRLIIRLFLMSLLLTNNLIATNIPKVFFKNLPEDITINTISNEMITSISKLAELNPELIYYSLKFTKNKNFTTEDSLNQIINFYKTQKFKWLKSLKQALTNEINDSLYLKRIFNTFDSWIPDSKYDRIQLKQQPDSIYNEIHYLVLKYYNIPQNAQRNIDERHFLSSVGIYDKNITYHPYRKEIEKQKRNVLYRQAKFSKDVKVIHQFLKNYYLFLETQEKLKAHKAIINLLQRIYLQNKESSISVLFNLSAGYQYLEPNSKFTDVNTFDFTKLKIELHNTQLSHSLLLGFNLTYFPKWSLFRSNLQWSPLRYFDFGLYLFRNETYSTNFQNQLTSKYSVGNEDYSEIMNYSGRLVNKNSWGLLTSLSIPLFAPQNWYGIEIGLLYEINYIQYAIEYEYTFKKFVGYWSGYPGHEFYQYHLVDERTDTVKKQKSESMSFFLPILKMKINILKHAQLQLMTGGHRFVMFGIGYLF